MCSWARKITATACIRLVPSMFTVAPTGSTNPAVALLTPMFSSTHRMVTGRVAALLLVLKASNWAGLIALHEVACTRSGASAGSSSRGR